MRKRAKASERKQLADLSSDFDPVFYLESNPDVRAAGLDPLRHYWRQGWKEGRNPNAWFDGDAYLKRHADVAASGENPFLHFVRFGRLEGRALSPLATSSARPHDALRKLIEGAQSAREVAAHYTRPPLPPAIEIDQLAAALVATSPRGVVVSFSHDDYAETFGGVQRLIGTEVEHFLNADWCYLHLAPARPLPILSDDSDLTSFCFLLRVNGEAVGSVVAVDLLAVLLRIKEKAIAIDLIVHHFMGHSPEIIRVLCKELQIDLPYVWIHDFYSLCESYNLLRNNWKFCGAPRVDSMGCRICVHGNARPSHFDRMRQFFATLQPAVLAPSEAALKIWRGRGLPYRTAHIVPIAQIVRSAIAPRPAAGPRLRVAFLGQSAHAKGWTTFRKLVAELGDNAGFEFFHLGTRLDDGAADTRIHYVPVQANRHDRDAMTRALAESRIDVVLLWSAWPESFCYAVHEAVAAGVVIIANSQSGNVPSVLATHAPERSAILDSEAELFAFFGGRAQLDQLCARPAVQGAVLPYESSAHITLRRWQVELAPFHQDGVHHLPKERVNG